jgi:dTDP-4-amino-4,6-dideoxygalactose transaminase
LTPISSPQTVVPLCDLGAQLAPLREEIREAIDRVLASQAFIMGPEVGELEKRVANYSRCQFAVGCSSGTDALLLALMALGVTTGDEVITTPFTFFATAGAIARLGARPVFVDIEPEGFNLDPSRLEGAITPRTKAIIPVHLYGQMADMAPIMDVAKTHGLTVVEDAAQAIGAEYCGRRAGSIGDVGCFSFFPSKNLGCLGDGGMVVTGDAELANRMGALRAHGAKQKYFHTVVGGNFRLDTLQAAVLLVKLSRLDGWNTARRERASVYRRLIAESSVVDRVAVPTELPDRKHIYNQFVIRTGDRDRVLRTFKNCGIGSAVYYPLGMHLQECFRELNYREGDFPNTERACREVCALPMFPELETAQQALVVDALTQALTE